MLVSDGITEKGFRGRDADVVAAAGLGPGFVLRDRFALQTDEKQQKGKESNHGMVLSMMVCS
jgi:hypothetical protein